ncbi:MAG TPA: sodium:proton antiporter [Methylococcaceae bacterium]|nr:sodium:proton antiporter [Methylococcaceae bacterium]
MAFFGWVLFLFSLPIMSWAGEGAPPKPLDLTQTWAGYFSLVVIVVAYIAAMFEDVTFLRKSKPMLLGASLVWIAILVHYQQIGDTELALRAFKENLQAFFELLLFIMVSMSYLNVMEDMRVFDALRVRLLRLNMGYKSLFWITGIIAFLLSTMVNGLTTGLLVGAVAIAVGKQNPKFVSLAAINIVVACNAGGSFSPLGGISTLFVWQGGVLKFTDFFLLFLPCVVNFVVPALMMSFVVPRGVPKIEIETIELHRGTKRIIALFVVTISLAVVFNMALELPPAAGMMAGLSLLQFFSFYLMKTSDLFTLIPETNPLDENDTARSELKDLQRGQSFLIFEKIGRLEWDTLFFFYGAMVGIGGLGFIGYLDAVSGWLFGEHSPTVANILIGLSSAFVDNGTLMFAVLNMHPDLPMGQWLLVTLTLGVGGSLLAIGSAPGIGLMGIAKGKYTFASHMKWCPAILLGYFAAIGTHLLVNAHLFQH